MTEKLYDIDSYIQEFDAIVKVCEPSKEGYKVVLDRTTFFPEGGGQYADTGVLGDVNVLDVQEKENVIWHFTDAPLPVGASVHGRIDWEKRFESMQQHTGEHIVSGIVHERFGYNNVGFHLGADYCTMDFNGPITREELKEIEQEANRAVYQNLDIEVLYPTKDVLEGMEYRSKIEIEGQVRIVRIPGIDTCACCAPHVKKTGAVGNIKLVNMANYKGGERITMLCGFRALWDYDKKDENTKEISALLCAKEERIAEAVKHLKEEQVSLKGKVAELQHQLLAYRAKEIDVSEKVVKVFDGSLTGNGPRELMNQLLDRGASVAAVFVGTDAEGYRYVIGSHTEDVRALCRELNASFDGRGGGKPEMVQGSLKGTAEEIRSRCVLR